MVVFRYDKTFEGLMCALFDAYDLKLFPEHLIAAGETEPMFTLRMHEVVTDKKKSDRVWKGLERKIPREVRNMLMHVWLSEEDRSDELIFRYVRKIFDSRCSVYTDFTDDDMLEAKKIAQKVAREALYLIQLVRFQKAGDDTYFAPVTPKYNALPLVIDHFTDRFADQKWLIYDMTRKYGYYYDLRNVEEISLLDTGNFHDGKLNDKLMAEDEKEFQELWRSYFKALTIKERINPKLHRKNLPPRFWKHLTEKQ